VPVWYHRAAVTGNSEEETIDGLIAANRHQDAARLAGELFVDDRLRMAVVAPARYLRGLERHLRLPA